MSNLCVVRDDGWVGLVYDDLCVVRDDDWVRLVCEELVCCER